MSYSILSPFLVPEALQHGKKINIGDGFILKAIRGLLLPEHCEFTFSSREPLSDKQIEQINATKALILAGANQLSRSFTITPQSDHRLLERIKVPVIPFGIGIAGYQKQQTQLLPETHRILSEMHQRIRYSSWRCPLSTEYLLAEIPALKDQALMTGCPVIYGDRLINGEPFADAKDTVVVTVTEREDFWQRESMTIDFVAHHFPKAKKILSLHQVFSPKSSGNISLKRRIKNFFKPETTRTPEELHDHARSRGFEIYVPNDVDRCQAFYKKCDLHIGSRLHAHLFFLSQAKKTFLTYVDDRMTGMAQAHGFPICNPADFTSYMSFDFETVRKKSLVHYQAMDRFVSYVKTEVLR